MARLFPPPRAAAFPWFVIALACSLAPVAGAGVADAKGTARVQQHDGSVQVYPDVTIRLIRRKSLTLTTADGQGTLTIDKGACSYVGDIQRCLPYHVTLTQGGATHTLDFDRGTVYANLTDQKQQLPLSSTQLPPRGLLMALITERGTYITLTGKIDEVTK